MIRSDTDGVSIIRNNQYIQYYSLVINYDVAHRFAITYLLQSLTSLFITHLSLRPCVSYAVKSTGYEPQSGKRTQRELLVVRFSLFVVRCSLFVKLSLPYLFVNKRVIVPLCRRGKFLPRPAGRPDS